MTAEPALRRESAHLRSRASRRQRLLLRLAENRARRAYRLRRAATELRFGPKAELQQMIDGER